MEALGQLLNWFVSDTPDAGVSALWSKLPRLSADELSAQANLPRLFEQRRTLQAQTLPLVAKNWQRSVFYQVNLKDMAAQYEPRASCAGAAPYTWCRGWPHRP